MLLRVSIIVILLSLTLQTANAQQTQSVSTCPVITVSCPNVVDQHENMICSATVSNHTDPKSIRFKWHVSQGKVVRGQNTDSIEVDAKRLFPAEINATAEVLGAWPTSCPRQATASTSLAISDPGPKLYETLGSISFAEEKKYLDRLALLLKKDPGVQPYILVYAGRRAYPNEALERGERAKTFLVKTHGIENARVVVVDAGYRETRAIELWLVPQGASPPVASPTVDPSEVEVLKDKGPKRKKGSGL